MNIPSWFIERGNKRSKVQGGLLDSKCDIIIKIKKDLLPDLWILHNAAKGFE